MSSDEDFSFVMEDKQSSETSLGGVKNAIAKCQAQYDQLLIEQKELSKAKDGQQDLAEQFRQRSAKLIKSMEEDQCSHIKDVELQKNKQEALQQQDSVLKREIHKAEADLRELGESNDSLKLQTDVSIAVPEKKVVFTGVTGAVTGALNFQTKPRIVYPMEGGTALITFDEVIVAKNILRLKEHKVDLGEECTITLEAKPVQLMIPSYVELDTHVCPRRILVSDLPKRDSGFLLDKLEIHFGKTRHGGGEVEETDMLHDSGNVVITFVHAELAKGLTDKQYHDVEFDKGKKCRVKVTPFLNGEITNIQTKMSQCERTVLLLGISAIMEQESLQDLLEIHFQKSSNGGGEVEVFLYNPLGQQTLAIFEEDCPTESKSQ